MPPIRFVIIGCGRIAQEHAKHIHHYGALVAVCDTIEERAKAMAAPYGIPYFSDTQAFYQSAIAADVVVICSPNGLHAIQAKEAMLAGYHVLVEKPMTIHSNEALELVSISQQTERHLFTVLQNRFNEPVQLVKQLIDNQELGILYSMQLTCLWNRGNDYYTDDWHGSLSLDGGTLFTQFSHFIDLLLWYFGPVEKLQAYTRNHAHPGIKIEDGGVVLLDFKNGMLGTIHFSVNSFEENMEGSLTLLAEKGTVKIGGPYLNTISYQQLSGNPLPALERMVGANDYGTYQGSMKNHAQVYQSLFRTLTKAEPYYIHPAESIATIELIERIYASAQKNT